LINSVKNILQNFGVNRAIGYGVLTRAWSLFSGPITIIVIGTRYTKEQQGFYYTFGSLLALQIFFELGLMSVLSQFASHEFAHLTWGERGRVEGDPVYQGRFTELLCKSLKLFGAASLLMIIILTPLGLIFLGQQQKSLVDFAWRLPWILAVLATAANLLALPFMSVIMGSGEVKAINYRTMVGTILGSIISWIVISLHGGLYAAFAVNCGIAAVSWSYLIKHKPELLKLVWHTIRGDAQMAPRSGGISWWREVWPMQWKIALSWISGYFIFQLFTPVLFHYHGAVVAGQMGMTLSISNALFAVGMTWFNASSPEFGKHVAKQEWRELDTLFANVFLRSTGFIVFCGFWGWIVIWCVQNEFSIGQRFLPAIQVAVILCAVCIQNMISGFAIYLRSHKKEPFLVLSVVGAIIQGSATWFLGMRYSSLGIVTGYLLVSLCYGLPTAFLIWKRCKIAWHSNLPVELQRDSS
jgi:O-antigen/teichoic acid export membrane protein